MRPAQLRIVLEQEYKQASHAHHTPVMLWGAPGVGKSQLVAQLATRHQVPMIDIRLSQEAFPEVLLGSLQACVGSAAGLELHAFIENLADLPDTEAILRGEPVAATPDNIDLQYAVALASRALQLRDQTALKPTLEHILNYAERLPMREMGVMLVSDLARTLGDEIFQVPAFRRWAQQVVPLLFSQ